MMQISLTAFFVLAFAVSWLGAAPVVIDSWWPDLLPSWASWLQLLMFCGTALVAIFVTWWNEGRRGITALLRRLLIWRVGWHWYAIALLAPAVLFGGALQISSALGAATIELQPPLALLTTFGAILAGYLLLNTEELAWRGYAMPRLLARHNPWHASLILGGLLGIFHLPLFLIKGGHPAGYPLWGYLLMVAALTVVFNWLFLNTKGSLLMAHLFHQTVNSWAEVIPFYPRATGTLLPFLITVTLLVVAALCIRWWWLRVASRSLVAATAI
jgi:membrane protease YdiL (CAAX protease family)